MFHCICDPILENQYIEINRITQFIVTTAKGLQNFSKYFQLFSGNSRWELHIVTSFKFIGSSDSSFWL